MFVFLKPIAIVPLLFSFFHLMGQPRANELENHIEELAYCYQPLVSNEPKAIYTINSDGTENQLLMEAQFGLNHHDWSPDGLSMVAVGYPNQTTWSLYSFNTDGTGLLRLTSTPDVWDAEAEYSPDGNHILFTRIYPQNGFRSELWLMSSDGSDSHWLGIIGFGASWSPDGEKIVYQSAFRGNSELCISNLDRTGLRVITQNDLKEMNPDWSSDGQKIVFSSGTEGDLSTFEIYSMNTDGSELIQLTNNNYYEDVPKWSPNDSQIAYHGDPNGGFQAQVFVMNRDGNSIFQVTNTTADYSAINPVWKPGSEINSVSNIQVHDDVKMLRNYPNPCSEATTIQFLLSKPSIIDLDLINGNGSVISNIVDNKLFPKGNHHLPLETAAMKQGVYYLLLMTDETQIQKEMIIIL